MSEKVADKSIQTLLDNARIDLLDLSSRNRLIHMPIGSKTARILQVFDEHSEQVFQTLVPEKKAMMFLPGAKSVSKSNAENPDSDVEELTDLPVPDNEDLDEKGKAKRHTDNKLQTRVTPELLQRRLFDFYNESREIMEEQGVNILYLTLGCLKWIDKDYGNKERFSPLVMVPVELIRGNAREKFSIRWREEDVTANLCLEEKMRIDFGFEFPPFGSEDSDTTTIQDYFSKVAAIVKSKENWEVQDNTICLGFFSFAKYLMYKDLDATKWPEEDSLLKKPIIRHLLSAENSDGQSNEGGYKDWESIGSLDDHISADRLDHVVDADSSQTIAIEMIREGRSLVIQGPPGTGKSQTITNIIATAVLDGKRVLFLAEKLAALEVVKRRLEAENLGAICLELHSSKARKNLVLQELKKTWDLGKLNFSDSDETIAEFELLRKELSEHPARLHTPLVGQTTPYLHLGLLSKLGVGNLEEQRIQIQGIETWSQGKVVESRKLLSEFVTALNLITSPKEHVWRGVELEVYVGTESLQIESAIKKWSESVARIKDLVEEVLFILSLNNNKFNSAAPTRIVQIATSVLRKPGVNVSSLFDPIWEDPISLRALTDKKVAFETLQSDNQSVFIKSAWGRESTSLRQSLVQHGKKWYKFIISDFNKAVGELSGLLSKPLPKSYEERLALIDLLLEGQTLHRDLEKREPDGKQAFGPNWNSEGNGQDLSALVNLSVELKDAGLNREERAVALGADSSKLANLRSELLKELEIEGSYRGDIEKLLKLNWSMYKKDPVGSIDYEWVMAISKSWLASLSALANWVNYFHKRKNAIEASLKPIVDYLENYPQNDSEANHILSRIIARQGIEKAFHAQPELSRFDGRAHGAKVDRFKDEDQKRKILAKYRVLDLHYKAMPPKLPSGATGVLLGEVNKQRNLKAIRQLLKLSGPAVQAIKPVFMMSPLSVAQFLEPGKIEFDLLVVDEASQIKPVDALGAAARCKQIVVVGDVKQLPPTSFFSKMVGNTETEDLEDVEEGISAANEMESILTLCSARGFKETMLRWHYRSKHHSLIAVSNKEYYDNKLYIVPSPFHAGSLFGLRFNPVNGIYDRGNTRTNSIEARKVAEAVVHHAIHEPSKTLLVAAFSMSQQRAIQDEIERLRIQNPKAEAFFSAHPHEPFTVKNLENVQGDERDVVFLSVGYGKDQNGHMAMNFGPLTKEGGQRRLNVLISRAKQRCEVFASISDLDIGTTQSKGVLGLKQFLQFARTGNLHLAMESGRELGSPLEEAVKEAIEEKLGYKVHSQVGVSGFFIDLALTDPENEGRYVLGIECDGVAYHSSPSARERDRLRQSILESQGWRIHRLWGIDFFRKREEELARIKAAYEQALQDFKEVRMQEEELQNFDFERAEEIVEPEFSLSSNYLVCPHLDLSSSDPYSLTKRELSRQVYYVLEHESPIHFDEIVNRTKAFFGFAKAGDRFRNLIQEAIEYLRLEGRIQRSENFFSLIGVEVKVRNRGQLNASSRKVAFISNEELDIALFGLIKATHGLTKEEAAKELSRVFGFGSLRDEMREKAYERVEKLTAQQKIKENAGGVFVMNA